MINGPEGLRNEVDARKQHEVDAAIERLKLKLDRTTKDYASLLEAFEDYKTANDFIASIEGNFSEPEPIVPAFVSGKSESTLVAVGCDWHAFETVKPEQVNGLNEYNVSIARASIDRFHAAVPRWAEIHRAGTKIDTLVMAYLGDLMTGMLHEDQIEGNAGTPLEEALFVTERVIAGLTMILKEGGFKRVVVVSCDGNHSRITEKKRKANRVKHSIEWLIFHFVRQHFAGDKRIEFHISDGIHSYVPLDYAGGKTLRFSHGDEGIKYQGGIGGMSVTANRTIDKWNVGRRADLDIFGHHHTSEHPRRYVAVGSAIGYSPFSLAGKYEWEVPSQAILLFEKTRWETAYHKTYVRP